MIVKQYLLILKYDFFQCVASVTQFSNVLNRSFSEVNFIYLGPLLIVRLEI